jgi:hypothetical protein
MQRGMINIIKPSEVGGSLRMLSSRLLQLRLLGARVSPKIAIDRPQQTPNLYLLKIPFSSGPDYEGLKLIPLFCLPYPYLAVLFCLRQTI